MQVTDPEGGLRRELGLRDATSVVIGAIIGVGIFFTPTDVARIAGRADVALGIWALGGLVALLGAFTFAELGRRYPRAGGQYDVLRDAWGPLAGFLYVICNLTAMQTGTCAIIALICVDNLAVAAGASPPAAARVGGAILLIAGLALANAIGVRQGARLQNLTVYAKLATLAAVTALAVTAGPAPAPASVPPMPGPATWFAGLLPAMFSYGGWQQALWVGGEVKDPRRNLPLAILVGVGVVVAVYLAAAWAYFALLGVDGVVGARALAAEAVSVVVPGAGARLVAGAVAVSAFGVLNAQFLTGPRLTWALARDGRFFRAFAGVHAGTGTPVPAITLLAALSIGVLLTVGADRIGALTAWVVVVDALFFALTGLALPRLWARGREAVRWAWIAPVLFALLELGAVVGAVADPGVRASAAVGFAWIGVSALLYFAVGRRRAG